jgi:hypothetical protein
MTIFDSDCIDVAIPLLDSEAWGPKRVGLLLALRRLTRDAPMTYAGSSQLGAQCGVAPHTVLRWLDDFVERGILERHPAIDRRGLAGYSITEPDRWRVPWLAGLADPDARRGRISAIRAARPGALQQGALLRDVAKGVCKELSPSLAQFRPERRPHRAIARLGSRESAPSCNAADNYIGSLQNLSLREGEGEVLQKGDHGAAAAAIQRATGKRLWGGPERELAALVAEVGPGPVVAAADRLGPDIAAPAIPGQLRILVHESDRPTPAPAGPEPAYSWGIDREGRAVKVPCVGCGGTGFCQNDDHGAQAAAHA